MPDVAEYVSNTTIAELAERIGNARRVLITSHAKPDGDAIGSTLALRRALESRGQHAVIVLGGPVEANLATLTHGDMVHVDTPPPDNEFDLAIVVDTGAWAQLEHIRDWLRRHADRIVVIDHHARGDEIGQWRIIDPTAASTTIMLIDLLDEMGVSLHDGSSGSIAEALFVGLATDTGWFRHSNADARAFAAAARLISAGVNKDRLYQLLEETYTRRRLELEARALASLEYTNNGKAAVMMLGPEDFSETGADLEELTGMVNMPMVVADVQVSVLLSQREPGLTKVSFRSKPATGQPNEPDPVDVNEIARQFGGGGHIRAAGARLKMDINDAKRRVVEAIESI